MNGQEKQDDFDEIVVQDIASEFGKDVLFGLRSDRIYCQLPGPHCAHYFASDEEILSRVED